jgi:C1A family cysteine protease
MVDEKKGKDIKVIIMKPEKKYEDEGDNLFLQLYSDDQSQNNIIDWRREDAVGPVHKQGNCGGCWAITAAGVMESAVRIKDKT